MAKILYCHPAHTKYSYHIFTDLDFWDTRCLLKSLALVKRNFGSLLSGDAFPTQIVAEWLDRKSIKMIERRLRKAIVSPPRHVIVRSMVQEGFFEFDPWKYYPAHWTLNQALHFTYRRLPLQQGALSNPYQTVELRWVEEMIRVERVQRREKYDPVIRTPREARERLMVPSCF